MNHTSETLLASVLVARFLRSNNYNDTLDAFIREAGLPSDAGTVKHKSADQSGEQWTLEGIIQEKKKFDRSLSFERYGDEQVKKDEWSVPAPSSPKIIETTSPSNLLSVSVSPWQMDNPDINQHIISTSADKRLNVFKVDSADNELVTSVAELSNSPILSQTVLRGGRYQLLTSMSGQLLLARYDEVFDCRTDHTKYVVKVVACEDHINENDVWIVTAGWDSQVFIYRTTISSSLSAQATDPKIGEPVGSIKLATNPESILLVRHPDSGDMMLLVSRHDSTYIYYYNLEPLRSTSNSTSTQKKCEEVGKQNLAPHSNAWVAFSPSCLAQSPHDPGLIAVALSTLPHMKIMIVRLLFPSSSSSSSSSTTNSNRDVSVSSSDETCAAPDSETRLSQAMASLALQNREDAAILIQANTLAPQTAYSTPQVVWRPDGSGVFVNGDDGVIRGIEAKTGKVVAMLKNGHEAGSKVRSIWAGWVDVDGSREEWIVSGGFDKKLIVWK